MWRARLSPTWLREREVLIRGICSRMLADKGQVDRVVAAALASLSQDRRGAHPHCQLHARVMDLAAEHFPVDEATVCVVGLRADWGTVMPTVDTAIQALPTDAREALLANLCLGSVYEFSATAHRAVESLICELRTDGLEVERGVLVTGLLAGAPTLARPISGPPILVWSITMALVAPLLLTALWRADTAQKKSQQGPTMHPTEVGPREADAGRAILRPRVADEKVPVNPAEPGRLTVDRQPGDMGQSKTKRAAIHIGEWKPGAGQERQDASYEGSAHPSSSKADRVRVNGSWESVITLGDMGYLQLAQEAICGYRRMEIGLSSKLAGMLGISIAGSEGTVFARLSPGQQGRNIYWVPEGLQIGELGELRIRIVHSDGMWLMRSSQVWEGAEGTLARSYFQLVRDSFSRDEHAIAAALEAIQTSAAYADIRSLPPCRESGESPPWQQAVALGIGSALECDRRRVTLIVPARFGAVRLTEGTRVVLADLELDSELEERWLPVELLDGVVLTDLEMQLWRGATAKSYTVKSVSNEVVYFTQVPSKYDPRKLEKAARGFAKEYGDLRAPPCGDAAVSVQR